MSPIAKAVARGLARGVHIGLTGDTSSLRQMREQLSRTDTVSSVWMATGSAMRVSLDQVKDSSRGDRHRDWSRGDCWSQVDRSHQVETKQGVTVTPAP